ncbi:class I SAM-dependent methyltransferase [Rubinisphaera italica]|uniref:Ubiquinone/menaquinone biosynthesis C-methyltransferase UbiE n=1 Tax=Rubinisphaera italica TaxID=2527969 RepID=A0A5C5XI14_9PLAN|nr:class I SAM-dependent methyltransferase [Rubinisphaera italica]TWT61795.1 Ubiquinone/menaquinone biosynthesis C-methyltransferase UbiE [Rubinisphaera italica]HBN76386.1 methyltransferase type 11 [Planctomycetaceae bacterium]
MSEKHPTSLGEVYTQHHERGERLGKSFIEDIRAEWFCKWIGTGKTILDLGGRDGTLTRHFAPGNQVVIGDIDTSAMAIAERELGVDTIEVNLNEALPFEDSSFDVIVLAEVLEHLPYPKITFGEIQRILKPGGMLVGSIPLAYHLKDRWQVVRGRKLWMNGDPTHVQFFKYDDLLAFFKEYLDIEQVVSVKGGKKAEWFPKLFARDVAFCCRKAA